MVDRDAPYQPQIAFWEDHERPASARVSGAIGSLAAAFLAAACGAPRLDEAVLGLDGYVGRRTRCFLHALAGALGRPRWLEIGARKGSALIAAARGGCAQICCVDVWREPDLEVQLAAFGHAPEVRIVADSLTGLDISDLGPFDVLHWSAMAEAPLIAEAVLQGFGAMADLGVVVVENWNFEPLHPVIFAGMAQAGFTVRAHVSVRSAPPGVWPSVVGKESDWHNGLAAMVVERVRRPAPARGAAPPRHWTRADLTKLMLLFQSVGESCAFGFAQRAMAAEPIHLFRFAGLLALPKEERLPRLIGALRDGLARLGEPGTMRIHHDPSRELMIDEDVIGLRYHTFQREGEVTPERVLQDNAKKLAFLRRQFLDDLAEAAHVFVWFSDEPVPEQQIRELHAAMQRYGPAILLWVEKHGGRRGTGDVEWVGQGLLHGFIDHGNLQSSWAILCINVYRLLRAQELVTPIEAQE